MENIVTQKTFFGRRKGKGMSKAKEVLLENYLCDFEILIPKNKDEKIDFSKLFDFTPSKYVFEIGYGTGEHLIQMALKNPTVAFIGTEVFINGNASIIKQIIDNNIKNIRIFPNDVNLLFQYLPEDIFDTIYILYPDPWPKNRNENRRIINNDNIKLFARLIKSKGNLLIVSDHHIYTTWVLFIMQNQNLFRWDVISSSSFTKTPPDWETTKYEQKAIREKRIPIYLNFIKN